MRYVVDLFGWLQVDAAKEVKSDHALRKMCLEGDIVMRLLEGKHLLSTFGVFQASDGFGCPGSGIPYAS